MYSSDDRGSKCPHCGAWTTYNDYFDLAQVIQDKKIIGLVSVVTLTELVTDPGFRERSNSRHQRGCMSFSISYWLFWPLSIGRGARTGHISNCSSVFLLS